MSCTCNWGTFLRDFCSNAVKICVLCRLSCHLIYHCSRGGASSSTGVFACVCVVSQCALAVAAVLSASAAGPAVLLTTVSASAGGSAVPVGQVLDWPLSPWGSVVISTSLASCTGL